MHILQFGSRKADLHHEALEVFKLCQEKNIRLHPEWMPREENEQADFYSKIVDEEDWQLSPQLFQNLDERWGPHSLDCFASLETKQLERFCSRWWNPGCAQIDAFTMAWEEENVWVAPLYT